MEITITGPKGSGENFVALFKARNTCTSLIEVDNDLAHTPGVKRDMWQYQPDVIIIDNLLTPFHYVKWRALVREYRKHFEKPLTAIYLSPSDVFNNGY